MQSAGLCLTLLLAAGCGTTATSNSGDTIDLDGIDQNDVDLDGVDIDQDTLSKLDIKSDTISADADAQDSQGTDAAGTDASGTDAISPDADTAQGTDAVDTASGCTATADCDDKNPCTDDTCGGNGVCSHSNNDVGCDDGNACTVEDACASGKCTGAAKNCADENVCTSDSCDQAIGCVHLANDVTCNDGIACTLADTCTQTACVGIPNAATCADGNECTTDSCDVASGNCVNLNNDATCTDNDACTTGDVCKDGGCTATITDCNDNNVCTSDACNTDSGACTHNPTEGSCDDGNICTTGDYCSGEGICVGDGDLNCNDDNACTADSCNSGITSKFVKIGCIHAPLTDTACSDGNACTIGDWCMEGACLAGDPTNCNDDNTCTDDSCNADTGACVNLANAVTCNDGDPCTLADTCTETMCKGTPNSCGQAGFEQGSSCSFSYCDYTDGSCKTSSYGAVWGGTFKTMAGWKLQGEWQIGLAAASTDQAFGNSDPSSDDDGDGYLAGTAIGLSISPTPHDWYYLTSPVIDLSMYATSTYLDYTTNWAYDHSMIFEFSWWANLAEVGETAKLEFSGDGKTWVTVGDTLLNVQMASWKYAYQWPYTGTNNGNEIIPKALLTKSFQFRIGYKVDSVDALIPLVSGISIDRPEIWVGTCWD